MPSNNRATSLWELIAKHNLPKDTTGVTIKGGKVIHHSGPSTSIMNPNAETDLQRMLKQPLPENAEDLTQWDWDHIQKLKKAKGELIERGALTEEDIK